MVLVPTISPARRAALYNWRIHQRGVSLSPEQRAALDVLDPGWHLTKADRWEATLSELVDFAVREGRLPVQKAADRDECRLAAWLATQRKNQDTMPEARAKSLDTRLPAWRQTRDDVWAGHLKSAADYLHEHGSFPRSSSDPEVRKLASWMSAQRSAAQKLSAARIAALDETIPGWRNRTESIWLRKLDGVAAHLDLTGALPRASADNAEEARMGFWLAYQRKAQGKLSPSQLYALDTRAPGWR